MAHDLAPPPPLDHRTDLRCLHQDVPDESAGERELDVGAHPVAHSPGGEGVGDLLGEPPLDPPCRNGDDLRDERIGGRHLEEIAQRIYEEGGVIPPMYPQGHELTLSNGSDTSQAATPAAAAFPSPFASPYAGTMKNRTGST